MGLLDSIGRGISAAGYAGGQMYAQGALEDQRSAIQAERDLRLSELQERAGIRAEDRKNAPLNRLSASAKAKMAEEIALEAAPVTAVSGVNPDGQKFGFKGDLKVVREQIAKMPDGQDKVAAMAQLDQQISGEMKTGLINVAGKTRKRTADEAMSAAVEDAKVSDLPALAAYESQIGKPMRDERRVANSETREDNRATAAAAQAKQQLDIATMRDATTRYVADLKDETANKRLETLVKTMGGGAAGNKDALAFIDGTRKDIASEAANLKALYVSDIKDVSSIKRKEIEASYAPKFAAVEERRNQIQKDFEEMREKIGFSRSNGAHNSAPATEPKAAELVGMPKGARQIGTSGGKPVYETPDGKRFIQK